MVSVVFGSQFKQTQQKMEQKLGAHNTCLITALKWIESVEELIIYPPHLIHRSEGLINIISGHSDVDI